MIFLVSAMSQNSVIGINNQLPWNLPEDLKKFKELTTDLPIIMGRKTFESIGKILPKRINIVITSQDLNILNTKENNKNNLYYFNNLESAIKFAKEFKKNIAIIGGESIYKEALKNNIIDEIYLTVIKSNFNGDTFFPVKFLENFKIQSIESHINKEFEFELRHYIKD